MGSKSPPIATLPRVCPEARPKQPVHNAPLVRPSAVPATHARPGRRYVVLLAERQLRGTWSVDHCDTVAVAPELTPCRARLRHGRTPEHRPRNRGVDPIQSQHQQRRHQQRSAAHGDWYRFQFRCRLVFPGRSAAMIWRLSSAISLLNA